MKDQEEGPLLEAAQRGDPEALDQLLRRYQPQVLRFGLKMCRDPEDAKDVLQETLLAAARTLHGFRGASTISTWLYSIARSFCLKRRRRSVFAPELVSIDGDESPAQAAADQAPNPERALEGREISACLETAIASLEPVYREVLVLRDVEGLTLVQVAEVTGASLAAVKSRLHRARRRVRDRLGPLLAQMAPVGGADSACPDVLNLLSRHLEGEIDPGACAEMERHVAACPSCQGACDSLRQTLSLCKSIPTPDVPEEIQAAIRQGIKTLLERESSRAESP